MPKNDEKILYTVDKVPEALTMAYFTTEVVTRYTFRTRKAAREFQADMNNRTKKFKYLAPQRAVWGPDN